MMLRCFFAFFNIYAKIIWLLSVIQFRQIFKLSVPNFLFHIFRKLWSHRAKESSDSLTEESLSLDVGGVHQLFRWFPWSFPWLFPSHTTLLSTLLVLNWFTGPWIGIWTTSDKSSYDLSRLGACCLFLIFLLLRVCYLDFPNVLEFWGFPEVRGCPEACGFNGNHFLFVPGQLTDLNRLTRNCPHFPGGFLTVYLDARTVFTWFLNISL